MRIAGLLPPEGRLKCTPQYAIDNTESMQAHLIQYGWRVQRQASRVARIRPTLDLAPIVLGPTPPARRAARARGAPSERPPSAQRVHGDVWTDHRTDRSAVLQGRTDSFNDLGEGIQQPLVMTCAIEGLATASGPRGSSGDDRFFFIGPSGDTRPLRPSPDLSSPVGSPARTCNPGGWLRVLAKLATICPASAPRRTGNQRELIRPAGDNYRWSDGLSLATPQVAETSESNS
jgi:hypothetical protein